MAVDLSFGYVTIEPYLSHGGSTFKIVEITPTTFAVDTGERLIYFSRRTGKSEDKNYSVAELSLQGLNRCIDFDLVLLRQKVENLREKRASSLKEAKSSIRKITKIIYALKPEE